MKSVIKNWPEILYNEKLAWGLWFGLSLFSIWQAIHFNQLNTFVIYRDVWPHLTGQLNLYAAYPQVYEDANLYGPLFGFLIAPFSWLPLEIGAVAWVLFNASFMLFALYQLPLPRRWKALLVLLCTHEMMSTSSWLQINAFIGGCLVLGFAYTHQRKEGRALFFIAAAIFIKLLGVTALAFFFFGRPLRFVGWLLVWSGVFFFLPLTVGSFSYLLQTYKDWRAALVFKNNKNNSFTAVNVLYQNVSVIGMIRRIFYLPRLNNAVVLAPVFIAFISQYRPFRYFGDLRFRLYIFCSVLLSTVLFSTGSESPTYIIAMPGFCLWYLMQPKTKTVRIFFAAVFFFITFCYSDLLTPWFRETVTKPYSLKALPAFLVWLVILVQIHTLQFLKAIHPLASSTDEQTSKNVALL